MKTVLLMLAIVAAAVAVQAVCGGDALAQASLPAAPQAADNPPAGPEGAAAPDGNVPADPAAGGAGQDGTAPGDASGGTSPAESGTRGGTPQEGEPGYIRYP
jgi:hypothetical protein